MCNAKIVSKKSNGDKSAYVSVLARAWILNYESQNDEVITFICKIMSLLNL